MFEENVNIGENMFDSDNMIIPEHIFSLQINNENIKNIDFLEKYKKKWDILNFSNNEFFSLEKINNIDCSKLILSYSTIIKITIVNSTIDCLEMENCNIEKINFENCFIKKLIINNNNLEEINNFPNNLIHLEIKNNILSYFTYNQFLNNLQILYLDNNNIGTIKINHNNNLIKLSLNNNSISIFDTNIITDKMELLNLLNNCFDYDDYNIIDIINKHKNLKLFIENNIKENSDTDLSSDNEIIPSNKIRIFVDSDSDDDIYINKNNINKNNIKTEVKFKWNILI